MREVSNGGWFEREKLCDWQTRMTENISEIWNIMKYIYMSLYIYWNKIKILLALETLYL